MAQARHHWDGWAIGLSGFCLAHCLLLPGALAALPLVGAGLHLEWLHLLLALVAAPLSAAALLGGTRKPLPLLALAGLGVLLLVGGVALPDRELHLPVTVAGSLALVAAHAWNWLRVVRR